MHRYESYDADGQRQCEMLAESLESEGWHVQKPLQMIWEWLPCCALPIHPAFHGHPLPLASLNCTLAQPLQPVDDGSGHVPRCMQRRARAGGAPERCRRRRRRHDGRLAALSACAEAALVMLRTVFIVRGDTASLESRRRTRTHAWNAAKRSCADSGVGKAGR